MILFLYLKIKSKSYTKKLYQKIKKMYINLSNIPQWVLENSLFLKTLKEDCMNDNDNDDNYYIPLLNHYDQTFDFMNVFQKNEPYLNLDNYISIYLDLYIFLDFIGFEIPFYQLIQPKDYKHISHILFENNELYNHFVNQIIGVQYYAFHIKEFNNIKKDEIDIYLQKSIENNDYEWIVWFIKNVDNLWDYEHILFNFDYSNVSTKTFDLLYNINNVCYPNICESIIKYRKSELFIKYVNKIKSTYHNESLLRLAFERQPKENLITHMEFIKLMLNNGYEFHFVYEYSKHTYYSNNRLIMDYMYENYKEKINKNVVDICPVIHYLSLNSNICTYKEKCDILDFFIINYNGIFKMEKLLQFVFKTENQISNNDKNRYDLQFILTFMERVGHSNNIYSYMLYLYFNYKPGIETYIESSKYNDIYDIVKFRNTFKYVLTYKNVDYVNFYITHKLYSNDDNLYDNSYYIKYATYDINIFKMLYINKIGIIDLRDPIFMDAYSNSNINVILFMIQNKYVPSKYVKNMISTDYNQHLGINQVEINGVIQVEKYYTNIEFENKEKIYKMICVN